MIINPGSSTEKQENAGVGRSMAGQTVEPVQGTTVTAGDQSEIFNRYEPRTYNADGTPAAGNVASGVCSHAEGSRTTATGGTSHAEGIATVASGNASHAEGSGTIASGEISHAEGFQTVASGLRSHAEGYQTQASTYNAHTEGYASAASGTSSHAEGRQTAASSDSSHAEGASTVAAGKGNVHAEGGATIAANADQVLKIATYDVSAKTFSFDASFTSFADAFSHIEVGSKLSVVNAYYVDTASLFTVTAKNSGNNTVTVSEEIPSSKYSPSYAVNLSYSPATGFSMHAEGDRTIATGNYGSHAEGQQTIASGQSSHAEGSNTTASGNKSHAEGYNTTASGGPSHAEGSGTTASGDDSHAEGSGTAASGPSAHAEGRDTIASGWFSHAEGQFTKASAMHQHVGGTCNVEYTSETTKFIIGKGTSKSARANCFRVTDTGVYATGAHNTTGADYAELFEWLDGNPESADRCGRFVTLDGERIRLAGPGDDFILGIVSGNPSVVGDVHDDQWQGMYLYDVFGRPLWEDVEVPDVTVEEPDPENPGSTVTRVIIPTHIEHRQRLNPAYDGSQPYLPRTQRPEWDAVGMLGKLVAVDDGTCQAGSWCTVGDGGAATHSAARTRYRVMARLDETHVRVLIL